MLRKILLIVPVVALCTQAFGQARTGDDLFDNFEFTHAIRYYEQDRQNLTDEQLAKLAFSYFSVHNYQKAEPLFLEVIKSKGFSQQNILFLAICQKNNLKFDDALSTLELFQEIDTTDFDLKEIHAQIDFMKKHLKDEPFLELIPLDADNTPRAEFSPVIYKEGVLFAGEVKYDDSKKRPHIHFEEGTDPSEFDYGTAERPLTELFYTEVKDGVAQQATVSALSEKFHIGAFCFNPADQKLYFTRTDLVKSWNADLRKHPRLFLGDLVNGMLDNVEKVKVKKLHNEYGSGHPAFLSDGKTMYFASDMPGGHGGSDLYMTTMDDKGNWTEPVNLGSTINTPADEVFPYVYNDKFLYFSSNGHPGMGHLDLFKAPLSGAQPVSPVALPIPLNSVADDFGIAIDPEDEMTGFVTSNRAGGSGDDDIYFFQELKTGTYVQGTVFDYNGNPLANALVAIYDEDGNLVGQVRTDENGKYEVNVPEGQDLLVVATTNGFAAEQRINTGEDWDPSKALDLHLQPSETVQGTVYDENDNPAANLKLMLYDEGGNIVFNGMTDENGNYQFPLELNKEYDVVARKEGYKGSAHIVTDNNYDSQNDTDIRLRKVEEIFGTIKMEDGSPVANALVKLLDENGKEIAQVRADENGNYRFEDVEGERNVIIEASVKGYAAREVLDLKANWDSSKPHDITLLPAHTAQGLVTDENGNPSPNTTIGIYDSKGNLITESRTDDQGRYQLVMLEDGEYDIRAAKGNLEGSAHIVANDKYDSNSETNIQLKPRAVIQGIVRNEDGTPAAGVTLNLYDENGNLIATATTDENGMYRFDVDKNRNYQVQALVEGYEGLENFFTGENWDSNKMHDIKLSPAGKDSYGIVSDNKTNKGINKVKATLIDIETGKKVVTYTDASGKFHMKLSPKTKYVLKLEKDGYFPKSVEIPTGGKLPEKIDLNKQYDLGMDYAGFKIKPIYFDLNKYSIKPESKAILNKLAETLKQAPDAVVEVRAFADCRGTDAYNKTLTKRRADAVKNYLVAKGVKSSRIKIDPKGKGNYVNNCYTPESCAEEEHGMNRRAEFQIDFR